VGAVFNVVEKKRGCIDKLKIGEWGMDGFSAMKSGRLKEIMEDEKDWDIMWLPELKMSENEEVQVIEGYRFFSRLRVMQDHDERASGGIGVYVKKDLRVRELYRERNDGVMWIEIILNGGRRLRIAGVYMPLDRKGIGKADTDGVWNELRIRTKQAIKEGVQWMWCGDFNTHVTGPGCEEYRGSAMKRWKIKRDNIDTDGEKMKILLEDLGGLLVNGTCEKTDNREEDIMTLESTNRGRSGFKGMTEIDFLVVEESIMNNLIAWGVESSNKMMRMNNWRYHMPGTQHNLVWMEIKVKKRKQSKLIRKWKWIVRWRDADLVEDVHYYRRQVEIISEKDGRLKRLENKRIEADEAMQIVISIIKEAEKKAGLRKKKMVLSSESSNARHTRRNTKWWNYRCEQLKKEELILWKKRCERMALLKTKGSSIYDDECLRDIEELHTGLKKKFRAMCKFSRRKFRILRMRQIEGMKRSNSSVFFEEMKKLAGRSKEKMNISRLIVKRIGKDGTCTERTTEDIAEIANEFAKKHGGWDDTIRKEKDLEDDWRESVEDRVNAIVKEETEKKNTRQDIFDMNVPMQRDSKNKEWERWMGRRLQRKEIIEALASLKRGKAAGRDGITTDAIIYGGKKIADIIWLLFRNVWDKEEVPSSWWEANVKMIYKKGAHDKWENYRGIVLQSVVCKLFEKVVFNRLNRWVEDCNLLGELQGGYRQGRGGEELIWLLLSYIKRRRRLKIKGKRRKVYAVFIDIKKCFPSVWRDGLWYKIHGMGGKGKIWRVLREMYRKVKNKIVINGDQESEWYKWKEGVKEGSVLSPLLFALFASDMEMEMKNRRLGAKWGEEEQDWMGMLKFADDMVLIADTEEELDMMMKVFWDYTRRWRIIPHPDKTKVVVFGGDKEDKMEWDFGTYTIKRATWYEYLGVILNEDMTWKDQGDKLVRKMKKVKGWLGTMGVREGLMKTSTARELWGILVYGGIEYGSEVWGMHCEGKRQTFLVKGWRDDDKKRRYEEKERRDDKWGLEVEQRKLMKDILKVGIQASSSFAERESGIYPLVYRRRLRMLKWWGKMIRKGEDRLIRRVYDQLLEEEGLKGSRQETKGKRRQRRIINIGREDNNYCYQGQDKYKSWVWEVYETLKRWGLEDNWNEGKGTEIVKTEHQWKKKIEEKMQEIQKIDSDARLLKSDKKKERTIDLYLMMIDDGKAENIKTMTQGIEERNRKGKILIRRMLTGTSKLENDIGRWRGITEKDRRCNVCNQGTEDILHLLFECEDYKNEQDLLRRQWGEQLWEKEMKVRGRKGKDEDGTEWFKCQIKDEDGNWKLSVHEKFVSMMGGTIMNISEHTDLQCANAVTMRSMVARAIEQIWKKRNRILRAREES